MNSSPKVMELLDVLTARGLNDEAVKNVRNGLWEQAHEAFMTDMLASLTEEDLRSVEASATQEEANAAVRRMYQEKTGKDMDEEMRSIVDQQAATLIEKYKVAEAGTEPVVSESTDGSEGPAVAGEHQEEDKVHDLT